MHLQDLTELAGLVSEREPILSLYLNMDAPRRPGDEYKRALRQLLEKAGRDGASEADIERVNRFFDHEYNRQGRGVAVFSQAANDVWRVYQPPMPVNDMVFVGLRAYLTPLTDLWDEYGRLAVLLVDREGAKVYRYELGGLVDTAGTMGEEVKRHKQGGTGAQKLQRHEDGTAKQNLKEAVEWVDAYLQRNQVDRIVLAGTDDTVAQFRDMLPNPLADKVIGQVNLDMNATPTEAWDRACEVAQQAVNRNENDLLQQVVTVARKGGAGALGLADTLVALQEGRVYHLLLNRTLESDGWRCPHCRAVVLGDQKQCPYCAHDLVRTRDAVNLVVQRAVEGGARVSVLHDNRLLEEVGGIAAVLRY